jgi:hypothetical protein
MRTRDQQIAAIRADQELWRDLAAEVTPARYAEPGPMGEWSFADMAGHLLGWRRYTIARMEAYARGDPPPTPPWPPELDADGRASTDGDPEAINAWIRAQDAARAPEQLVGDYTGSYDRIIAVLGSMSDAKLTDPDALPSLGGPLIDIDFTGHLHEEHLPSVRAWLRDRRR